MSRFVKYHRRIDLVEGDRGRKTGRKGGGKCTGGGRRGGGKREKKRKITQHCIISVRNRKNAKRREPTNTGREPGLKGTGSGRFKPPCPPPRLSLCALDVYGTFLGESFWNGNAWNGFRAHFLLPVLILESLEWQFKPFHYLGQNEHNEKVVDHLAITKWLNKTAANFSSPAEPEEKKNRVSHRA